VVEVAGFCELGTNQHPTPPVFLNQAGRSDVSSFTISIFLISLFTYVIRCIDLSRFEDSIDWIDLIDLMWLIRR
jgi:hypothetical protein